MIVCHSFASAVLSFSETTSPFSRSLRYQHRNASNENMHRRHGRNALAAAEIDIEMRRVRKVAGNPPKKRIRQRHGYTFGIGDVVKIVSCKQSGAEGRTGTIVEGRNGYLIVEVPSLGGMQIYMRAFNLAHAVGNMRHRKQDSPQHQSSSNAAMTHRKQIESTKSKDKGIALGSDAVINLTQQSGDRVRTQKDAQSVELSNSTSSAQNSKDPKQQTTQKGSVSIQSKHAGVSLKHVSGPLYDFMIGDKVADSEGYNVLGGRVGTITRRVCGYNIVLIPGEKKPLFVRSFAIKHAVQKKAYRESRSSV